MAKVTYITINKNITHAKSAIVAAIHSAGLTLEPVTQGYIATKGSKATTLLLGALASKKSHYIRITVRFFTNPDGHLVSRFEHNMANTAMMSGAIGASRAATDYDTIISDIQDQLRAADISISIAQR